MPPRGGSFPFPPRGAHPFKVLVIALSLLSISSGGEASSNESFVECEPVHMKRTMFSPSLRPFGFECCRLETGDAISSRLLRRLPAIGMPDQPTRSSQSRPGRCRSADVSSRAWDSMKGSNLPLTAFLPPTVTLRSRLRAIAADELQLSSVRHGCLRFERGIVT